MDNTQSNEQAKFTLDDLRIRQVDVSSTADIEMIMQEYAK